VRKALAAIFACCALLPVYALSAGESVVTRHRCADLSGKVLWEASDTLARISPDTCVITEESKGTHYGFEGETVCKSRAEYRDGKDGIRPLMMSREVFSSAGEKIFEERQEYDPSCGSVKCTVKDIVKEKERSATFKYNGSVTNSMLTGTYVRSMLAAGGKRMTVSLVNGEPALYSITVKVVGREKITVNGRERDAFKVCIDPNIGILSPAKAFIPRNYSWYSCEPPHKWLKFRGLEGSLGSPVVEITTLDN